MDFRERHHRLVWALLGPVRLWFQHFPVHRGKGWIYRNLILPALPPRPAAFPYRLRDGQAVELFYREDLGTKVLFGGAYEEREAAELCQHVRPGTWVFDVGANIGLTSLEFARVAQRVLAFEPNPLTAERLERNLAANAIDNVSILRSAVGATPGTVTFHESAQTTLSSASVVPPELVRSFELPQTTLDADWIAAGRPEVSALKIDVEGGELDVLRGAGELLASQRPAVLLEAWGAEQLAPIDALLAAMGYERQQPEGFEERNYLFLAEAQRRP
jgi:FkbM family methyltransferase